MAQRITKLMPSRDHVDDLHRVMVALNFSETILACPCALAPETVIDTTVTDLGGVSVDRSVFRKVLPDHRWLVYAAGRVDPRDADGVIIALAYVEDDSTAVSLGSVTLTGAGFVKQTLGPFDVFATAGVPAGE